MSNWDDWDNVWIDDDEAQFNASVEATEQSRRMTLFISVNSDTKALICY